MVYTPGVGAGAVHPPTNGGGFAIQRVESVDYGAYGGGYGGEWVEADDGPPVLPPSDPHHPGHAAGAAPPPHAAEPGPVAATFRVVKHSAEESIGWTVTDEELRVIKVLPNRPAAIAGMRPGMRVVDINGATVGSVAEMKAALAAGTVFNVTVEIPPASGAGGAWPLGAQVMVHGAPTGPGTFPINGLTGHVTGHSGGRTLVDVPGHGVVPLPAGNLLAPDQQDGSPWVEVDNPEVGRAYFWNTQTGETTWDHPLAEPLPPGIEEVILTKEPGERIGLGLEQMAIDAVEEGSPADRGNVHPFIGWRLTHVNGSRVGSTDDVSYAARGAEQVCLRMEVGEVTVRKDPREQIGCELRGMLLGGVVPGSALDRALGDAGAGRVLGQRLTHVNGARVATLAHVMARAGGSDAVVLRFEAEEIEVVKAPGEPLGLVLEGMRLQDCHRDSPSKRAGVACFLGRRLTHVDGAEVRDVTEVAAMAAAPRDAGAGVVLRFEPTADAERRDELAAGAVDGIGSAAGAAYSAAPPRDAVLAAAHPATREWDPARVDRLLGAGFGAGAPALPPGYAAGAAAAPGRVDQLDRLEQRVAGLERGRAPVTTPEWSPAARVLVGPPPWEVRQAGWGGAGGGAAPPRADRCAECGGPPEIDCFDCPATLCRGCCLRVHRVGRRRLTHTRMAARAPEPWPPPGGAAIDDAPPAGVYGHYGGLGVC